MKFCHCGNEAKKRDLCVACHNREHGQVTVEYTGQRISRNQRCPCGSGKKFKDCHRSDVLVTLQAELREGRKDGSAQAE